MHRALSFHANLENIKQEARDLLHALRRGDASALRRYHSFDPLAGMLVPSLGEAQYIVAREYGCGSWQKLKERLLKQFPNKQKGGRQTALQLPNVRKRNERGIFSNS